MSETIDWNDFIKVDMRIGRIVDVRDFPEARKPAYILTVDFGPLGIRKTSAHVKIFRGFWRWKIASVTVYGVCLFLMFLFSTLYHSFHGTTKGVFQRLDHIGQF